MTVRLIDRVSRTASKTRTRARLLTTTILLGGAVIANHALAGPAQPSGGQVVAGQATIATTGATTTITQSSGKAVIDWSSFSIGQGGEVDFNNGSGATLNRVTGGSVSSLDGLLKATGSVYLINPNGVIIGKSGVVQVGGSFVASALDLTDSHFMAGGDLTFAGPSTASVVNLGQIGALGGDVSLLALNVRNDGAIAAANGTVGLAAGRQIILRDTAVDAGKLLVITGGADTSVTHTGTIEAAAAELRAEGGNVYALAGNTAGVIRATGVSANDGKIWLTAGPNGSVKAAGSTLAASDQSGNGGTISVTGGQVAVASDATLDASATATAGNGGTVSVIADKASGALTFAGTALARGGVNGGLGGFVETSGHTVDFAGARIATAGAGHSGNWLIDPYDLTIDSSAAAAIVTGLNGGNVSLQTTASGSTGAGTPNASGQGDIIISSDISWATGSILTLDAYHSVIFNANVTASGAGGVVIKTNDGGTGGDYSFTHSEDLNQPHHSLTLTTAGSLAIGDGGATPTAYTLVDSTMAGVESMDGVDGHYALVGDVSAGSFTSNPVGMITLATVFTGLGHTIDGLIVNVGGDTGLIYENDGVVRDLGVTNVNISGSASATTGVIAYNYGIVQSVYTAGRISSDFYAGGIAGYSAGTIRNSSSSVDVTGGFYAGGLVGQLDSGGVITNSYATGSVSAAGAYAGGLVGGNSGTISYSYATGTVSGSSGGAGGIVGADGGGTLTGNYWDATTTGQADSTGGVTDITGAMTTADLQNGTLPSGFDSSVWGASSGGYPYLISFHGPAPAVAQIISGTAYNLDGTLANGASISLYVGGTQIGSYTTHSDGVFNISLSSVAIRTSTDVGADLILSSGTHVSGLIFTDTPSISGNTVSLAGLYSGKVSLDTTLTSWSALQTALSATFGSSHYGDITTNYGAPAYIVSASGAFTFDQAVTLPGSLEVSAPGGLTIGNSLTTVGALTLDDAVTLAADATLAAGNGAIDFTSTLDSDGTAQTLTLSTTGTQTFGGVVGGTHALASLTTGSGVVDVNGAITTNGSTGQIYNGAVVLGADTTLTAGNGAIDFTSTLNSDGTARALTLSTSGQQTFSGVVGGSAALTSLATGTGQVQISTAAITTSGVAGQVYNGAVVLTADTTLTANNGGAIDFTTTVDGHLSPEALTLSTTGTQTFGGVVGGSSILNNLVTGTGVVDINTTAIKTIDTSGQVYNGAVVLGTDTSLTAGGALTFGSTVNGGYGLTLSGTSLTFDGVVGGSTHLTSLSGTAAGGDIDVNGQITTTGGIFFAANGKFVNTAGATALNAGTSFTVYTQNASNPAGTMPGDTWDGLTATNYYNDVYDFTHATFAGAVPAGNHFVYAYQASVTPTLSGSAAKTYDALTTADTSGLTVGGTLLSGSDSVTFSIGSAGFDTKNAGSGKTVTASGISLASNPNNYTLASTTASAAVGSIAKAALTLSAVTDTKTYDTTTSSGVAVGSTGLKGTDHVTATQSFGSKDVLGAGASTLSVNSGYVISDGNSGGNYTVTTQTASGTIDPATVTAHLIGTVSKTYDGTDTATLAAGNYSLTGVLSTDQVNLNDPATGVYAGKDVASGIGVTATGLALSGTGAGNYSLASTSASGAIGTITPASLTATLTGAVSKTFDGLTTVGLTGANYSLAGVFGTDDVALTAQTTGYFDNINAGTGKTVSAYGLSLSGGAANDYTVNAIASGVIGTIGKASLTLTASGGTKTYDGTTASDGTVGVSGLVSGTTITGLTQSYDSRNAGTRTLAVNGGYMISDGNGGGNYTVTTQTASGTIGKATLTLTASGDSKTYDATATSDGMVGISGLQGTDSATATQSFNSRNAGNRTLLVDDGYVVSDGNNGGNYTVTTESASGTIGKAVLILSAVADTKTYDATTASGGTVGISGLKGTDSVTATQSFDSRNAGNRTLFVDGGYLISDGNGGGNYTVATHTAAGTIGKATLTAGLVGTVAKTYDATLSATLAAGNYTLSGIKGSDLVGLNDPAAGTYADANLGTGKTVSVTGLALTGADAGNYTVNGQASGGIGTVSAAPVTVTAGNASKIAGAADPLLAYAITSGQLYGTDAFTGSLGRASGEQPASYAITQGTLVASANYDVTFIGATFTIQPGVLQNLPLVNPIQNGATPLSGPPLSTTPSSDNQAPDAQSSGVPASATGDAKASGPAVAGQGTPPPSTCPGGDGVCSNMPYPGNSVVSSHISFQGH